MTEDQKKLCGVCSHQPLKPQGGPLPMLSCGSCRGNLLLRNQAQQFVVSEVGIPPAEVSQALAAPGLRQVPCGNCSVGMTQVTLRGVSVDLCSSCGAMWFEHGVIEMLSGGMRQEPRSASAQSGPSFGTPASAKASPRRGVGPIPRKSAVQGTVAPRRVPMLSVAAGLGALVVLGGLAFFLFGHKTPATHAKRSAQMSDADFYQKYAGYFSHYIFGGHPCDWWAQRLADLAPGGAHADAELLKLALHRAQVAGLKVSQNKDETFDVTPGIETVMALVARTEAK